MTKIVKNESKTLKAALTGKGAYDSRQLENIFEKCRQDEAKMLSLVKGFCKSYLMDNKQRPLLLRPLQLDIIVKSLIMFIDILLTVIC